MMAKKEVNDENPEVPEEGKKKSKKLLIIILVFVLLLLGGGGVAVYYYFSDKPPSAEELAKIEAEKNKKPEFLPVFSLKPFVVNLADGKGRRYLKVSMKLELSSDELLEEVEKRQPQIRDVILTLLSSKTSDEVNSMEGKFLLREEIIKRVNTFLITGKITKIYLEEFVVQ
ncbi:MAG: flagellar basal body-associated FliL family protein [Pseudomonadota bacterium]|nr:flagellar basal body-associated FliL family protein [Pseudomonadota bacterium]